MLARVAQRKELSFHGNQSERHGALIFQLDAIPPWIQHPHQITSWWDMLNFDAKLFIGIARNVAGLEAIAEDKEPQWILCQADLDSIGVALDEISEYCSQMGLRESSKMSVRAKKSIQEAKDMRSVSAESRQLYNLIKSECESHLFFFIPFEDEQDYSQDKPLFGVDVERKFPKAEDDIAEAGKCFALNRNTGCVLHSMRVLEHGLHSLSRALNVPFSESSWNGVLVKLEKKWNQIEARSKKPKHWKKDRQFYSEVFIEFRYIKDAWRNYAMHGHARYDRDQAQKILTHVKALMQTLATRLREVN